MENIKNIKLTPAGCAVDLSDGSERGLYVGQDYILRKLGRPHRAVNIMYCYYPLDETWPKRAQDAYKDMEVGFAWDYPYDNYFPYLGGINGNAEGEPFTCMRDIRRHGQDVILTLTCDPKISDEHMIGIAKDLKPFGRMMLRLNHECTGSWFSFNKRASYKEIADFFVRFHKIMKKYAPNVSMILCAGAADDKKSEKIEMEELFTEAFKATEIWSIDKYIALNWGWPYEVAEKDNNKHLRNSGNSVYEVAQKTFDRLVKLTNGQKKPIVMSELNADGDVTGPYSQANIMRNFARLIKNDKGRWFSGFCFYQFRDDGRLGLEITDPNNSEVGIEQPVMSAYRDIIHDDFFKPKFKEGKKAKLPVMLRWGGSEDADGISMELDFEADPVFAEANFEGELENANLMMEINGTWFYKAPGVKFVDFMPAFFNKRLKGPKKLNLNIFAPPATGENDPKQGKGWDLDYYYELKELPDIRLRFEPICR
ncbi:MAG: hypothetical protein K6E47_11780 [Lachnospiraceae bacterium]|nr:hypothetical protein [Lachnospiraceae bacterium]